MDLVERIDRLMTKLNRPRKTIVGCEQYEHGKENYLYRYYLLGNGETRYAVYLHVFLRSDEGRDLHDHPWPFISIILWKGYIERTYASDPYGISGWFPEGMTFLSSSRKYPGMILFRGAKWRHRVDLVDEDPAVSLVIRGRECRHWGFWTKEGWIYWKNFFKEKNCYNEREEMKKDESTEDASGV
jgi:hypothetical protein